LKTGGRSGATASGLDFVGEDGGEFRDGGCGMETRSSEMEEKMTGSAEGRLLLSRARLLLWEKQPAVTPFWQSS
jgi:hypothetical protein